MPNYNHARFIREALEAALAQSVPAREVIVVDDASTDDSREIVAGLAARHPSVRLLEQKRNQGVVAAMQRGLEACSGDYVAFFAADDQVLPGHFERSLSLLARHPGAGLCSTLARLIGEKGEDLGPYHTPRISETECFVPPERFLETYERWGSWIVTYSAVFRRSAVLEIGGFDAGLGPTADGLLNLVLPARHGACFIPEPLVLWRKLDTGYAMSSVSDPRRAISVIEALDARLREPRFSGLFSPSLLTGLKRHALALSLYEHARVHPDGLDDLAILLAHMPEPDLLDAAMKTALRAGPAAAHAVLKLYLFLRQKPADRLRIAAAKISGASR
ncbi:MAG: hypothetical protein A2506_10580 [Elusimicrobia bacterium RIFOXYD12_FULL_66_9]|nr:MAG: hypothetical protein A2506_10580 [Elusimicrobia bacterium RIFOXYD12_FULL_66_9]